MDSAKRKILHVVESYGGGVATSLRRYVRNAPEYEHHILLNKRPGATTESNDFGEYQSVRTLASNPAKAIREVRRAINEIRPHAIHAHSSFAGAYTRIAVLKRRTRPIVYTPHGFSFERRDASKLVRALYLVLENLLSLNTSVIAGCSPREVRLAQRMFAARVEYLPNVAEKPRAVSPNGSGPVVALGRITAARSPEFFLSFVESLAEHGNRRSVEWIGGGEVHFRERFEAAGVKVTGWLEPDEAIENLRRAALLIHPAAWDGFPMAVLEANANRVPVLVRDIPAFSGAPGAFGEPEQMALAAIELLQDEKKSNELLRAWSEYLKDNSDERQREVLTEIYNLE